MSNLGILSGKISDFALAPAVVSTNLSCLLFQLGVGLGARSAQSGARMVESLIPGGQPVKLLSRMVADRAASKRQQPVDLAYKGMKAAMLRLSEQDFDLPQEASLGYNQMAADTLAGPVMGVLMWPATVLMDFMSGAPEVGPVGENLDLMKRTSNALLDTFSVSGEHTRIDTVQLRDHFLSMTIGPGGAVLGDVTGLFEGALRTSLGNTRKLGQAIRAGVKAMEYPKGYGEHGLLYPDVPITRVLHEYATKIVEAQPTAFIEALEKSSPPGLIRALAQQPDKILAFFMHYPLALLLVMHAVVQFLETGLRDVNDVEHYLKAEDDLLEELKKQGRLRGKDDREVQRILAELHPMQRPLTVTEFEYYVGNAKSKNRPQEVAHLHPDLPSGPFRQATIDYAQETAFSYSSLLLGRAKALKRIQRIYGPTVRERIERDPSLEVIRFKPGLGYSPEKELQDLIKECLVREKDRPDWKSFLDRRIASLKSYRDDPKTFMIQTIRERIDHRIGILKEVRRSLRLALPSASHTSAAGKDEEPPRH